MKREKVQSQLENIFFAYKILVLPVIIIMSIVLTISIFNSLIEDGNNYVVQILKDGLSAICFVQEIVSILASAMCIFIACIYIQKNMTSSTDENFYTFKFEQVNGIALKAENRKGFTFLFVLPIMWMYIAISLIPFIFFFISSKFVTNLIIDTLTKFYINRYKCPRCKQSMQWKKQLPFNSGINNLQSQVIDYYFYCPKCQKYYIERLVLNKYKYKNIHITNRQ